MPDKDVFANSGTMTPYTGTERDFKTKAIAIVNGKRYLLKKRLCARCMHSMYSVDRSPLRCRIGLCGLELPQALRERLAEAMCYGDSVISRFYYIQRHAFANAPLPEADAAILLEDARVLDIDDKESCFKLTNSEGLYRVRDLAWLCAHPDREERFVALPFAKRDAEIERVVC